MRKYSKFMIILVILLTCIMIPQTSFANANVSSNIATWDFNTNPTLPVEASSIIGFIVKLLRNVSIIITIIVIIILGIKYMIGSVQQKADYKKDYINIIIGVVMVTLITSIVDAIFSITQNL